jgi:Amt family ammonium transporter
MDTAFMKRHGLLLTLILCGISIVFLTPLTVWAETDGPAATSERVLFVVNNTWMLVATILVFIMHLGFALLESGLTRAKNTVNILFKNVAIVGIGVLTYAAVGFSLMYPGQGFAGGWIGFGGFGVAPPDGGLTAAYNPAYTYWTDFIFQAMFAATAATIVSGAVAERIKIESFLVFSALFVAICYPIVGMWHWGGGWLAEFGFYDFAGSTIVHSVGGWGALAGVLLLGPRAGKYVGSEVRQVTGHNLPLAALGVFLLWFGWFGFNGGSVLSADPAGVSHVFVTTTLAACGGLVGAMATSWIIQNKPDLSMVLNGILAGLVGVTAGADVMSPIDAVIVGSISGILVVVSVIALDQLGVDDPVGAISVHLVCGIWGTLAVGLFGAGKALLPQLVGVAVTGVFTFGFALTTLGLLKTFVGLRVTSEEELRGLDIEEHGQEAYAGVQISTTQ